MSGPSRSPVDRRPLVVVGDVLLDIDLDGVARRLSPEAPVPVISGATERRRPGGAALAALLASRLHPDVVLIAALADDAAAAEVTRLLSGRVRVIAVPWGGTTSVKTRLRAGGHAVTRLDTGGDPGQVGALPDAARQVLRAAEAVLVADYGLGCTSDEGVRAALAVAARRTPLVWDPHPRGAPPIAGARLVTPNESEAAGYLPDVTGTGLAAATRRAAGLVELWGAGAVALTLGARGALLSYGVGAPSLLPAAAVHADDTCGAGDAFAAAATAALGRGLLPSEAVAEAVRYAAGFVAAGAAATLVPGEMGAGQGGAASGLTMTVPARAGADPAAELDGDLVSEALVDAEPAAEADLAYPALERVRAVGGRIVATGGCFDLLHAGHVDMLEAARALGDALVVCLNSDDSVRRLKGASRPVQRQEDRARILAALRCVDAVVVFEEDTPETVLGRVRPDLWVKGGDYGGADLPEARVVASWGGQVLTLPYLTGRSTSDLVETVRRRQAGQDVVTGP